ncbi:MAG: hypothetical protein ABI921_09545 [Panacibacter sp.]
MFSFFLLCFKNDDETYQRHIQLCSVTNAVDRKWQLVLNSNGNFVYAIQTIDTKANPKNSKQSFSGKWNMINDTLNLKVITTDNKIVVLQQQIQFIKKDERFFPVNEKANVLNGFVMELDFLEKK